MKLHWSPRSPFVRKVMIVLHETGQIDRVRCVRSAVGMAQINEALLLDNPLNKIPTLLLDDGRVLFDSRVICEYLDGLHSGTRLFPMDRDAYFRAVTWQALGDGLTDTLLVWRNWAIERGLAPEDQSDAYLVAFARKTDSALDALDRDAPALQAAPFGIGHIAIGCALGQLDFRWADRDWRRRRPALAGWEIEFADRPSAQATAIVDDSAPAR